MAARRSADVHFGTDSSNSACDEPEPMCLEKPVPIGYASFCQPAVLESLRAMIARAYAENAAFRKASQKFLAHAQGAINPGLTDADVREMLIQHVLTEEIFSKVFGEDDFHHHNNVAKELYALEETFFTGDLKKRTMRALGSYYAAILSRLPRAVASPAAMQPLRSLAALC